jgi:hypothetical protein
LEPDVDTFLERFVAFGRAPSLTTYLPLFHPDATLFDSGMERPIAVPEIPEHIEAILKLVPDFRMTPERWRARGRTLFVEARNQATLGKTPLQWPSVYCVDLAGASVVRGRRYYDRRPLFALLNPALPELPCETASERQSVVRAIPGGPALEPAPEPHPIVRLLPDLEPLVEHWAGDAELLFVEWSANARVGEAPLALGGVDRFELAGGRVRHARSYFDTLAVATRLAAAS